MSPFSGKGCAFESQEGHIRLYESWVQKELFKATRGLTAMLQRNAGSNPRKQGEYAGEGWGLCRIRIQMQRRYTMNKKTTLSPPDRRGSSRTRHKRRQQVAVSRRRDRDGQRHNTSGPQTRPTIISLEPGTPTRGPTRKRVDPCSFGLC